MVVVVVSCAQAPMDAIAAMAIMVDFRAKKRDVAFRFFIVSPC
jgi:hypothetical protein